MHEYIGDLNTKEYLFGQIEMEYLILWETRKVVRPLKKRYIKS